MTRDRRPPHRSGILSGVRSGWRLAATALALVVLCGAVGLGTSTTAGGAGSAHRGLVRVEATTLTILLGWVAVLGLAAAVWALSMRGGPPADLPGRERLGWVRRLVLLAGLVVVAFLARAVISGRSRPRHPPPQAPGTPPTGAPPAPGSQVVDPRVAGAGLVVALVVTVAVLLALRAWDRRRRGPLVALATAGPGDTGDAVLVEAIDAALGDLGAESDPRLAVIAAYAGMERVLARHGLPRHAWEAPTEYLDRALRVLGTRADGVERLTALFEVAKFSTHPIDEAMRREAVAALEGLRAGLGVVPA